MALHRRVSVALALLGLGLGLDREGSAQTAATITGTCVGYAPDPAALYALPPSLVAPPAVPSLVVPNPAGPATETHVTCGNFLLLPRERAPGVQGDFNAWRPSLFYRQTWADADGKTSHPFYDEGSPKLYIGGGAIIRDINDGGELVFDRANANASGALIDPTHDDTAGHIYARWWGTSPQGFGAFRWRLADIGFKYVHPQPGNYPGGRIDFVVARADVPVVVLEQILQLEAPALNGTDTGLRLRSAPSGAGAWRAVDAAPLFTHDEVRLSSGLMRVGLGETRFLGQGVVTTGEQGAGVPLTRASTAVVLAVRAGNAPGLGETFTYTVLRNGNPTSLVVVLAGDVSRLSDTAHAHAFQRDDRITVQVSASLGATMTEHLATVSLRTDHGVHLTRQP